MTSLLRLPPSLLATLVLRIALTTGRQNKLTIGHFAITKPQPSEPQKGWQSGRQAIGKLGLCRAQRRDATRVRMFSPHGHSYRLQPFVP